MEKRTKLGVAATSLAVAATLAGPATASAQDACIRCPTGPGATDGVFYKLSLEFDELYHKLEAIAPADVFLKFRDVFIKLEDSFFYKLNIIG